MNVYLYNSINELLKQELERRVERNPSYTLRAFARDLKISSSRLSEILNFKKGEVSSSTLKKIGQALQLSGNELNYFVQLTITRKPGNNVRKKSALQKLEKIIATNRDYKLYNRNHNGLLSKWYYIPLIEMVILEKSHSLDFISERLGISHSEAQGAVRHLCDLGHIFLNSEGHFEKTNEFLKIENDTPVQAIQQFHVQICSLAQKNISRNEIASRKYLTSMVTFEKKQIKEARKELDEFVSYFTKKYGANRNSADSVYSLGLQFFQLDSEGLL